MTEGQVAMRVGAVGAVSIPDVFDLPVAVIILILLAGAAAIVVPLTLRSLRRGSEDRSNDNVAGWALSLVGGAFIFVGTFTTVTIWDLDRTHHAAVMEEFGAATTFVQDLSGINPVLVAKSKQILGSYADLVDANELTEMVGIPRNPGGSGDPAAQKTIDSLFYAIEDAAKAGQITAEQRQMLIDDYEVIEKNRFARLSIRTPLPGEVLTLVLIVSIATLVLVGFYPAGSDTALRWAASITGVAVVVGVLSVITMLVSPETSYPNQIGPVEDLRLWLTY